PQHYVLLDVQLHIAVLMSNDSYVIRTRTMRRRINRAYAAPLRQILRRHVSPALPAVARDMNQPIVCSSPYQALRDRRLRQCEDGVVVFGAGHVSCNRSARWLLLGLVVASQVRTDGLPVYAAIGALK